MIKWVSIVVLMLLLATLLACAQLLLKQLLTSTLLWDSSFLTRIALLFRSRLAWGVAALLGLSFALWVLVLGQADLQTVYPMTSFSYVFVLLLSHIMYGSVIHWYHVVGVGLIVTGILLLGFGSLVSRFA